MNFISSAESYGPEFFTGYSKDFTCYDSNSNITKKLNFKKNILHNKIQFLINERKYGKEYCYKPKTNHIFYINDWFAEFYKDWHVIQIKRKNLWDHFVSWIVQDRNDWNHKYNYKKPIVIKNLDIDKFLVLLSYNINIYNDVWFYEDLTIDFLQDYFEIILEDDTNKILARRFTYKTIIKNYNEAKLVFDKKMKHSIIKYD